jgi:hypothetical protein
MIFILKLWLCLLEMELLVSVHVGMFLEFGCWWCFFYIRPNHVFENVDFALMV